LILSLPISFKKSADLRKKNYIQGESVYVCICNAFTEKQVSKAIRNGISSPAGVFRHLGCTPQCGKCVPTVRCMVKNNDSLMIEAIQRPGRNQCAELQALG
jgi:bacterioferritin-associated ferredoxin